MIRKSAFTIALTGALLLAAGAHAEASSRGDVQAPRGRDIQASRGDNEDIQAPREHKEDIRALRGDNEDLQAPRGSCARSRGGGEHPPARVRPSRTIEGR
jgi:hypothetical protein